MGIDRVPNIIYIDRHHNIWGAIPNKGVVCYNQQQQLLYEFGYTDDTRGVPQGVVCSISECKEGALIVYDAATFKEIKRLPMRKPVGKYNLHNKITRSEGTSH